MDELLTDQQQAERVRNWLRENGPFLFGGLLLGLAVLFGGNWWNNYSDRRGAQASEAYEYVIEAVRAGQPTRAAELQSSLAEEYSGSPYVDQARFALAKLHMDRNETDEAAAYLEQIIADTNDQELRPVAKLRLARVRLHQQQYDDALAAIADIDESSAFATRFHEVRGDIHYASGDLEAARSEYEAALSGLEAGIVNRNYVQAKLDNIGGAAAAEPAPAGGEQAAEAGDMPADSEADSAGQ